MSNRNLLSHQNSRCQLNIGHVCKESVVEVDRDASSHQQCCEKYSQLTDKLFLFAFCYRGYAQDVKYLRTVKISNTVTAPTCQFLSDGF